MSEFKLKSCPFCGEFLQFLAPVAYVHPIGKCILSGRNFHKGVIGQWNRRPTPPAIDPKVTAIVEAVKVTLSGYDEWANCASGTPEDTIATANLFHRMNRLRAALEAWEA